jgi:hypothetical protein
MPSHVVSPVNVVAHNRRMQPPPEPRARLVARRVFAGFRVRGCGASFSLSPLSAYELAAWLCGEWHADAKQSLMVMLVVCCECRLCRGSWYCRRTVELYDNCGARNAREAKIPIIGKILKVGSQNQAKMLKVSTWPDGTKTLKVPGRSETVPRPYAMWCTTAHHGRAQQHGQTIRGLSRTPVEGILGSLVDLRYSRPVAHA